MRESYLQFSLIILFSESVNFVFVYCSIPRSKNIFLIPSSDFNKITWTNNLFLFFRQRIKNIFVCIFFKLHKRCLVIIPNNFMQTIFHQITSRMFTITVIKSFTNIKIKLLINVHRNILYNTCILRS